MSKKSKIAEKKFSGKKRVLNVDAARTLGVGVTGTDAYMKPLGFYEKWETRRDSKGQEYQAKVWVQ